jgi:hypothetical protein
VRRLIVRFLVQVRQQFGLLRTFAEYGRPSRQSLPHAVHLGNDRSAGLPVLGAADRYTRTSTDHQFLSGRGRIGLHRDQLLPSMYVSSGPAMKLDELINSRTFVTVRRLVHSRFVESNGRHSPLYR